jgi:hypothetical protein
MYRTLTREYHINNHITLRYYTIDKNIMYYLKYSCPLHMVTRWSSSAQLLAPRCSHLPAIHHRLHMSIRPPGTDPARARLDTTRTSRAWPGTLLTRAVPVRITCQDMCPSTAQRGTKRAGLARKPLGHSGPCPPLARKSQNYKKSKILKF